MFEKVYFVILILFIICIISMAAYYGISSIFKYPRKIISIDISGKRKVDSTKAISIYISYAGIYELNQFLKELEEWKIKKINKFKGNEEKINKFVVKFEKHCLTAFRFQAFRNQTRYKQVNYIRTPYKCAVVDFEFTMPVDEVKSLVQKYTH